MNISPINILRLGLNKRSGFNCAKYNNLKPLPYDMVSFGSMKRSQFKGVDRLIIDMKQFTPPLEKFNNNEDFQKWCKNEFDKLAETDLEGRQEETQRRRTVIFKEWINFLTRENSVYTSSIALLILDGILKDVKKNNDKVMPPLNKKILLETINKISNTKDNVNFNKEYRLGLQNMSLDRLKSNLDSSKSGWIIIPSQKNDPEHFDENVDILKTLSYKNWCTASYSAEPDLLAGDFHIYLKNGHPEIGIKFIGDEIDEIQGKKNDGKIPVKYLNVISEYVKDKKMTFRAYCVYQNAEKTQNKIDEIKNKLKKEGVDLKTCSTRQLLDAFDMEYKVDKNGLLILQGYAQPDQDFTFGDMGISEDKMFKDIKEIKGNAEFTSSQATDLGRLETIGGNAFFMYSEIRNLGNLKNIGGSAYFYESKVKDLGNLETIGGSADFGCSQVKNLGSLKRIDGDANFNCSKITNLGNLETIGGSAKLNYSEITDLGNLKTVGEDINIGNKLNKAAFKNIDVRGKIIVVKNKKQ